ncbi:hypothetical protein AAG589_07280 [Isoptericola sp. F-RaC21]|uniref:hypothetical protein n=1 Tax=Isoptericola sp. F-RaC21 TaxID=3141452 RepID=UPI00315BBEB1
MGRLGADVDELSRLARALEAAAETLSDDRRQVGAAIRRARWDGSDAERFRHDWGAVHGPRLDAAARALEDGASTLRAEARAQRRASDGFDVGPTGSRYAAGAWATITPPPAVVATALGDVEAPDGVGGRVTTGVRQALRLLDVAGGSPTVDDGVRWVLGGDSAELFGASPAWGVVPEGDGLWSDRPLPQDPVAVGDTALDLLGLRSHP